MIVRSLAPEGCQPAEGQAWPVVEFTVVEPGFCRTLRIPLIAGRDFADRDDERPPAVVIVNDAVH